jgi:hypothetical protein
MSKSSLDLLLISAVDNVLEIGERCEDLCTCSTIIYVGQSHKSVPSVLSYLCGSSILGIKEGANYDSAEYL